MQDDPDVLAVLAAGFVAALLVAPWMAAPLGVLALLAALGGLFWRSPVLLGAALGWLTVATIPEGPEWSGPIAAQGVVVGAPTGKQADVALSRAAPVPGVWSPAEGRVRVRFPEGPPPPGTAVVLFGRADPFEARALPGDPDLVANARRSRVRTLVRAEAWAPIGGAPPRVDPFAGARHAGILGALAIGDRAQLPEDVNEVFRRTGTSHVLSISGFHVGLVMLIVGGSLRALLRTFGVARPEGVPDGPAWLVAALAGLAYAWIAGAPASAQRAAWTGVLGAVAHATGREVRPLPLLGAAAIAVLVVDPAALGTAGFQLSFGAMLGLVRLSPLFLKPIPPDQPRIVAWMAETTAATLGATLGTLPASAWWFQQLAPTAPIANLVALPWSSVAVVPCALGAAFLPDPIAGWCLWLGDLSCDVLLALLRPLAAEPWTPAMGPVGALACTAVLVLPRRDVLVGALCLGLLGAREPRLEAPRVTFLDVGQGDAALVEGVDGRRILVDGGPPGDGVVKYLRRRGIRHVDVVVASHGHPDHTGGLLPVLQGLHVGELWASTDEGLQELVTVAVARGVRVRFRPPGTMHPPAGFRGENLNDRSLVLALAGVLFPGDAEEAAEAELATGVRPQPVLKVGHHGSRTSSTPALLEAVDPAVAVISAGRWNPHGHPHRSTLRRLEAQGVAVFRTDRDGTIVTAWDGNAVSVETWRPGAGWSWPAAFGGPGAYAGDRRSVCEEIALSRPE
jgi:DNA internalization-related competence protein ComEC/Rec2